jgi:nucleolar protein 15
MSETKVEFVNDSKPSALNNNKKKNNKRGKNRRGNFGKSEHGFMYIGHVPHGFFEEEIKEYFSQFGKIVRVRLARSKATGNYKGYGFIEFGDKDVAQIAAVTMNNYLMFNKVLKCHVIPKEKIHPETFKNSGKLFVTPIKSLLRKKFNRVRSQEQIKVNIFLFSQTFLFHLIFCYFSLEIKRQTRC